jgi:hypothetical protein
LEGFNYKEEKDAFKNAAALSFYLNLYFVISAIPVIILAIVSFTPGCPLWNLECAYHQNFVNLWLLLPTFVVTIFNLVIYYFGQTFAAKVRLEVLLSIESSSD